MYNKQLCVCVCVCFTNNCGFTASRRAHTSQATRTRRRFFGFAGFLRVVVEQWQKVVIMSIIRLQTKVNLFLREACLAESVDVLFNCADLAKIIHEESSTSKEEGWTFVKKSDVCEVWRKIDPNHTLHLIKVKNLTEFLTQFVYVYTNRGTYTSKEFLQT